MPVAVFFRPPWEFRESDRAAVALARGRVLDVGAGVGSVALALQEAGKEAVALEVIPEGVEIMRRRGVREVSLGRIEEASFSDPFDTVLLLMNGAALAGTLAGLPALLRSVERVLAPGGQVLMDSTDLLGTESWEEAAGSGEHLEYPGDLQFQLEFRGKKGAPFPQLFIDPFTLSTVASREGWVADTVWKGDDGAYLARLVRKGDS